MKIYRQQAKAGLFQIIVPGIGCQRMKKYFSNTYGDLWIWEKEDYVHVLLQYEEMAKISREFLEKAKEGFPYQDEWEKIEQELMTASRKVNKSDLKDSLKELYNEVYQAYQEMWNISVFIDALDTGADLEKIEQIKQEHGFSEEEVYVLLTPTKPSYLLQLQLDLKEGKTEDYFWLGADYSSFREVDEEFLREQMDTGDFIDPRPRQKKILEKHGIEENPLKIFQILAKWRDDRKKLHYVGAYGC